MLCSLGFKTRAAGTDGSTGLRYPTTKSWPVKSVISGKVRNSANVFLKKWPKPGLFLFIFVLFTFQFKWPIYNLNKINSKKHRWCAWDLNPGQQDGRRRQFHWAMTLYQPPFIMVTLSTGWVQVVNVRVFYSDDSSLNPSYVYSSFSFEKAKWNIKAKSWCLNQISA